MLRINFKDLDSPLLYGRLIIGWSNFEKEYAMVRNYHKINSLFKLYNEWYL